MQSQTRQNIPQDCDIIFIRHAQSLMNQASHQFRVKKNLPYIWELLSKQQDFLNGVKYNPDFVDCPITSRGKEQCLQARHVIDNINPDVILVSPLERTLMTCSTIFEGRNIPIFAEPILSQAFRSSCDISLDIAGKKQRYPHITFDSITQEGDLWFVKNQNEQNQKRYRQAIQKSTSKLYPDQSKAILELMRSTLIFEKPTNVRHRSRKIKQLLKKYKEKYNKIAVVAHYNTINYTVAKKFTIHDEPADSADVRNCQILAAKLQDLLKYE